MSDGAASSDSKKPPEDEYREAVTSAIEEALAQERRRLAINEKDFEDFKSLKKRTTDYLKVIIPFLFFVNAVVMGVVFFDCTSAYTYMCNFSGETVGLAMVFLGGTFGLSIAAMFGLSGITRQHWRGNSKAGNTFLASLLEMLRTQSGGEG